MPHVRQQLAIQKMKKLRDGEGWSLNRVAKHLNESGVLTRTGKKWDHKSVQLVLADAGRKTQGQGSNS